MADLLVLDKYGVDGDFLQQVRLSFLSLHTYTTDETLAVICRVHSDQLLNSI